MNGVTNDLTWVVTERSAAGDAVIGVFSTLQKAREAIAALARSYASGPPRSLLMRVGSMPS